LLPWFTPSLVWQSLVDFCGLKCVCKEPGSEEKRRIFGGWVK